MLIRIYLQGSLRTSALLDDWIRSHILLHTFPLHPTVYEYMVKQVELCVASRCHRVDPLGPVDLDLSMLAGQPLLGPATPRSLYQTKPFLHALWDYHHGPDHGIVLPADADHLETSPDEESKGRITCGVFLRRFVSHSIRCTADHDIWMLTVMTLSAYALLASCE